MLSFQVESVGKWMPYGSQRKGIETQGFGVTHPNLSERRA
jgi:hypothetical protein